LAEFGIAVEVFYGMVIRVSDGIGRADIGAGEASDAILGMFDHTEPLFRIQFEYFGRADIDAQLASPA
jgi:hypothetical protein